MTTHRPVALVTDARAVTHQVRRLEIAIDLPIEDFRARYEQAVPPFDPSPSSVTPPPGPTDWAAINRITDQQARTDSCCTGATRPT